MRIFSTADSAFASYGRIVHGVSTEGIAEVLNALPIADGMTYVASNPQLEALPAFVAFRDNVFGGMPIQMGYVVGKNSRLNALEHHMCSEIVLDTEDVVLLLAKRDDVELVSDASERFGVRMQLDTAKVKAFRVPAGQIVELYNSTLHFAPFGVNAEQIYRGLVVLSKGTNGDKPVIEVSTVEDSTLWAKDNWLLAHADSPQARDGAYVGLVGENIDVAELL